MPRLPRLLVLASSQSTHSTHSGMRQLRLPGRAGIAGLGHDSISPILLDNVQNGMLNSLHLSDVIPFLKTKLRWRARGLGQILLSSTFFFVSHNLVQIWIIPQFSNIWQQVGNALPTPSTQFPGLQIAVSY